MQRGVHGMRLRSRSTGGRRIADSHGEGLKHPDEQASEEPTLTSRSALCDLSNRGAGCNEDGRLNCDPPRAKPKRSKVLNTTVLCAADVDDKENGLKSNVDRLSNRSNNCNGEERRCHNSSKRIKCPKSRKKNLLTNEPSVLMHVDRQENRTNKSGIGSEDGDNRRSNPRVVADASESCRVPCKPRGERYKRSIAEDETTHRPKRLRPSNDPSPSPASNNSSEDESVQVEDFSTDNHPEKKETERNQETNEGCLIPPDFRLQRASFDGTNHTLEIAPHDRGSIADTSMAAPYVTDIYQHLYYAETRSRPNLYMDRQPDINAKMRAILVDWLIEVHMKFRLAPETLYLCINVIDRYCSIVPVGRSRLQLVGVTALLIACKYEEIYPPEVRDCVYITDKAYDRQEVLNMEQDILKKLRFKIAVPTAYQFLQRYLLLIKASPLTSHASHYYVERTLQEHDLLRFRPSLVCVASVVLALNNPDICMKDEGECSELPGMPRILMEYSGFCEADVMECAASVAQKVCEEPVTASRRQLVAVKRKYDHRRYLHVSSSLQRPSVRTIPFADDDA